GRRTHLLDEAGKELPAVFLPGEELWDPRFQRLTMTFDPGRIKRGLRSNTSMGPPLVEGRRYSLVIDRDWPDARDVPMVEGFRKSFRVGPGERTPPNPAQWRLSAPGAGTTAPLAVDFPKPMNYVLLQRMLRIADARGSVSGTASVERSETRWLFTPRAAWKPGDYRLVVDTAIEDLAGNRIGQAFDIDVFERVTERITGSTITLAFRIRQPD
ncbi:MAG TPA: Ig-like domain-containing protein, partial [Bryobacteraceae bacterium]|nr:Ig-like domain-containing protein [Bryobacteraceae bacterium]